MRKNPELVDNLIKLSPLNKTISQDKKKRIADAIRKKNAPPEPAISVVLTPE